MTEQELRQEFSDSVSGQFVSEQPDLKRVRPSFPVYADESDLITFNENIILPETTSRFLWRRQTWLPIIFFSTDLCYKIPYT